MWVVNAQYSDLTHPALKSAIASSRVGGNQIFEVDELAVGIISERFAAVHESAIGPKWTCLRYAVTAGYDSPDPLTSMACAAERFAGMSEGVSMTFSCRRDIPSNRAFSSTASER